MESCATVTDVKVLDGYQVELSFDDGLRGVVDLASEIVGDRGVFQALCDPAYFRQVRVDPELGMIVWPNHADLLRIQRRRALETSSEKVMP